MATVIVTGSGGLIGSEAVGRFASLGFDVVGIENDLRALFFGPEASTAPTTARLRTEHPQAFRSVDLDVRDADGVRRLIGTHARDLALVVHAAAQPSHDWAATDPTIDFSVNAVGTLNLLEAVRATAPDTPFVFMSTNKVYGDTPNRLPLTELETRLELPGDHQYAAGIDTTMSIDGSTHSVFGVSKASADLMVQEYGRYFGMPTVCLRGGCLTGPGHQGARLHGFLAYLMRCVVTGTPYVVHGYDGKQVRDNVHARDVVGAMEAFRAKPRSAAVYNFGGGRESNCSMREAIAACEAIAGRELDWSLSPEPRVGDHRWWISDLTEWRRDYPEWRLEYGLDAILREIHDRNAERWLASAPA